MFALLRLTCLANGTACATHVQADDMPVGVCLVLSQTEAPSGRPSTLAARSGASSAPIADRIPFYLRRDKA